MIPKKIHYCWLSGEIIPQNLQICIDSWKNIMPEYEFILWDTNRFDITSNTFVKEAFVAKKWAFASDYIRLYSLYTEGGIYMDVDVCVKKKFDDFLTSDFFTSVEYHYDIVKNQNTLELLNDDGTPKSSLNKPGIGIQAAVLGSIKEHLFLKDCLEYYKDKHFLQADGELFNKFIAPGIYAMIAEKYGFRYIDETQNLKNNMLILSSDFFASEEKDTSYAIHHCYGSWRDRPKTSLIEKVLKKIEERLFWKK